MDELDRFEPPPFAVVEITNDPFFLGEILVTKSFEDVRSEVSKLTDYIPPTNSPDE